MGNFNPFRDNKFLKVYVGCGRWCVWGHHHVTLAHTTNVGECVPILLKCIELNMVKEQMVILGFINKNNPKNFSTQLIQ
jgi:hypothetical protein